MLYHNLPHIRLFVHAIVDMQIIYAVRQIGYIELYCPVLGFLLPQHIALPVVQADIKCRVGGKIDALGVSYGLPGNLRPGNSFIINLNIQDIRYRVRI